MAKEDVIFYLVFAGVIIFAGIVYLFVKLKESTRKKMKISEVSKKLPKSNSREFLNDAEDIREGIVITDNGTRFVSAIRCTGYDFYYDTYEGQLRTMEGYQRFFKTIDFPITYRISSKGIDADEPIKNYERRIKELTDQYDGLTEDYGNSAISADSKSELEKKINSLAFRINHLVEQLELIERHSSSQVVSDTYQCYVFDWKYDESSYSVKLTKDEIFAKAKRELYYKAQNIISSLRMAHVDGTVLNQSEMVGLFREVSRPYTSQTYDMKMVGSSSYFDDVLSSESINDKRKEYVQEQIDKREKKIADLLTGLPNIGREQNTSSLFNEKTKEDDNKKDDIPEDKADGEDELALFANGGVR